EHGADARRRPPRGGEEGRQGGHGGGEGGRGERVVGAGERNEDDDLERVVRRGGAQDPPLPRPPRPGERVLAQEDATGAGAFYSSQRLYSREASAMMRSAAREQPG